MIELTRFLLSIRRVWWIVPTLTVLVVGASVMFTLSITPIYQATTTVVITISRGIQDVDQVVDGLRATQSRTMLGTLARLPGSGVVAKGVLQDLKLPPQARGSYTVQSTLFPDTSILRVTVRSADPGTAAAVSNATASQTQRYAQELFPIVWLSILDPAVEPSQPVHPRWQRVLWASVMFGLVIGIAMAWLIGSLRDSWSSKPPDGQSDEG
jgi:capsular polysaccharide biosynthesis protein